MAKAPVKKPAPKQTIKAVVKPAPKPMKHMAQPSAFKKPRG